jgi:hypothetical protein
MHAPLAHAMPQPPQFSGSLSGLLQRGPHTSNPGEHDVGIAPSGTHRPPVQVAPAGQLAPQLPQLSGSRPRFVHPLGQKVGK